MKKEISEKEFLSAMLEDLKNHIKVIEKRLNKIK